MIKNHIVRGLTPLMMERIKHIHPGGNIRDVPKKLLPKRFRQPGYFEKVYSGKSVFRRLTMDSTAPTILASIGDDSFLIHPTINRLLTLREKARLQTFPDEFEFSGSYGSVHRQIGNAVPVLLAHQLARALRDW